MEKGPLTQAGEKTLELGVEGHVGVKQAKDGRKVCSGEKGQIHSLIGHGSIFRRSLGLLSRRKIIKNGCTVHSLTNDGIVVSPRGLNKTMPFVGF